MFEENFTMKEYILRISDNKQSTMLMKYLKSLDYVSVEDSRAKSLQAKKTTVPKGKTKQEKDKFINFLEALPQVDYTEQEVNEAITEMRKVS